MHFNRFIFENYLKTEEGIKSLEFFNDFVNNKYFQPTTKEYIKETIAWVKD